MKISTTPLGLILRGLAAGAIGAGVQTLYFKMTSKVSPQTSKDAFEPPEPEQRDEMATETVARRFIEHFMQRGPLTERQKSVASQLVHFGFGAAWGELYAVIRESFEQGDSATAAALFGALVWLVSDNTLLPVFKLSGWPQAYPVKNHLYAALAHLVFGLGLWSSYEILGGFMHEVTALPAIYDIESDYVSAD